MNGGDADVMTSPETPSPRSDHLLWRWPSCSASVVIAMRDVRISSPFDPREAGRSIWSSLLPNPTDPNGAPGYAA